MTSLQKKKIIKAFRLSQAALTIGGHNAIFAQLAKTTPGKQKTKYHAARQFIIWGRDVCLVFVVLIF